MRQTRPVCKLLNADWLSWYLGAIVDLYCNSFMANLS